MKKSLLMVFAVVSLLTANSQTTIFNENFNTGIPNTWTLINNDNKTPAANVSFVNAAWVWDDNQQLGAGQIAVSTHGIILWVLLMIG